MTYEEAAMNLKFHMMKLKFHIRSNGRPLMIPGSEKTWNLSIFMIDETNKVVDEKVYRLTAKELEELMLVAGRGLRLECEELT